MVTLWVDQVYEAVKALKERVNIAKGLILTEGDLECNLFKILSEDKLIAKTRQSKNQGWVSFSIHSQVTWFKQNLESGFEVDLTICDPENIDINTLEAVQDYPSKGFFHDGPVVGIELKFIRNRVKSSIESDTIMDYKKIVNKLSRHKLENIKNNTYSNISNTDLAFFHIVQYKTKEGYVIGKNKLDAIIGENPVPENIHPILFHGEAISIYNDIYRD